MRLLLIGAPGSGKGTQGARIAARYDVDHIAAGDILRAEVGAGTVLGRQLAGAVAAGELVPDQVILDVVVPRVQAAAAGRGYVLDGFPRTVPQAAAARAIFDSDGVAVRLAVHLEVPEDLLVTRLSARAAEQGRADDTPAVIQHRLDVFRDATTPLLEFYAERGLLRTVDGAREPDEVTAAIIAALPPLVRATHAPGT